MRRSGNAGVRCGLFGLALVAAAAAACGGSAPAVEVLRAPAGASLPQAAVDGDGRLHLIYYTGSMRQRRPVARHPGSGGGGLVGAAAGSTAGRTR